MAIARIGVLLVLLALSGACSDDDGGGNDDAGKPGDAGGGDAGTGSDAALSFQEFDSVIEKFLQDKGLAGATAAVVHKQRGHVHERGYGSFDKSRLSLIASTSKVLSVGVLMALVDAGKLDLDKPISTYLAAWGSFKTDVTTAMLLSNSSGLVSLAANPYYGPYICQYTDSSVLETCAKSIYTADDKADSTTPDTTFSYGGAQWQLSGGIAEVVSAKRWPELIKDTYVTPCGTASLGFTNQFTRATAEGSGTGYPKFFMGDTANLPMTENPNIEGGGYVTAGDYAKILLMHLQGGLCGDKRVLSEASVKRMQVDRIAEKYNGSTTSQVLQGYGMGWWIDRKSPGFFADPGLYGAIAWLNTGEDYGAYVALEATSALGTELLGLLKPVADAAFQAAK
jgi:CubicO group peptidase (beta-lactamase class C family)